MQEDASQKKCRSGTVSCTECRRRKVRCIRSSEDAQSCRRCEERGSKCIPQTYSSKRRHPDRLPSQYRISQLELQVASLIKVVRDLELRLGYQPTHVLKATPAQPESSPSTDDDHSDNNSSMSDEVATDPPSHLRSLFQNDWLSVDLRQQNEQLQDHKAKTSARLLDMARRALQRLIPSQDDVSEFARSASGWLALLHTLLPQPLGVRSQQDMLEGYEEMHKPDVDAISLASWLLTIAITALQSPQVRGSSATKLKGYHRFSRFSRAVSDTVESTILSHDRLICTIPGLGMAMHFLRLQMSQGKFQKAWLRLRHIIAIAELMGLPKAFQSVQLNRANGIDEDEVQLLGAQLWESICSADGLSGMIVNLPPYGSPYQQTSTQALTIDGVVQPRAYLSRLINIARTQYRNDMNMTQGSNTGLYASAWELDIKLNGLASQTPKSWWAQNVNNVIPDQVVQFWHYCVKMRVHLSFAMRQDPSEENIYSCFACRDACEAVAKRYQFLRRELPLGFFLCHALDLQAFTATVVLLLMSHSSPSTDRSNWRVNRAEIDSTVAQVIKLMDEKSKETCGSNFAQHGVATVLSLNKLLLQDGENSEAQELTLKIPLLGKVHIRRNGYTSQAPNANNQPAFRPLSNSGMWKLNDQFTPQEHGRLPLNPENNMAPSFQTQGQWQWDPFSWSIEDYCADFFPDTIMTENDGQYALWENGYT